MTFFRACAETSGHRESTPRSGRNVTVDVAKGFGISLVVLGHNAAFRTGLHSWYEAVYLFHVPLFFFLSGVTFKPATLDAIASRRARILLVPYFAIGAVAVAAAALGGTPLAAVHAALGVLYGTGHTLRFTPLWFLPCLFLVVLAAAWFVQRFGASTGDPADVRGRRALGLVALISVLMGLGIIATGRFAAPPFLDGQGRPLGLPWSLDLVPLALGVFIAGFLCARSTLVWQQRHPLMLVVASAMILAWLTASHVSVDLNYRRISNPVAAVLAMASGIAFVIGASELVIRGRHLVRPMTHLGSSSLVLLIFHGPIQRRVVEWLTAWALPEAVTVVVGTGLTIGLICAADLLVLRRVPALSWIYYPQQQRLQS